MMRVEQEPRTHALTAWMTTAVEIADCIIVPLLGEDESAGLMFETWPEAVRGAVLRYLNEFRAREAGKRAIVAITHALIDDGGGQSCVTIVHHRPVAGASTSSPHPSNPAPGGGRDSADRQTSQVAAKPRGDADVSSGKSAHAAHHSDPFACATCSE